MLVTTSVDSEAAALSMADALVRERLAACVHVGPPGHSIYHWQGRLEHAREWVCQIKTAPVCVDALIARIRALHPYEVPEILAVEVALGDPAYLAWVAGSVETA